VKALVKAHAEPGLWLEDISEPAIGINDVLIRVHRTGICGTDVHIYEWDAWARQTIPVPMAIGHEFVGEIVEVGSNVIDFHPGELVSGEGHVVCGRCRNCMAGDRHLCAHTSGVGVNRPGCFAELIALPMTNIWRHDPRVNRDAGPIGIMAAAVVRHAGARYVVITDVNEYRLDLARKLKVDLALNVKHETVAEAQKKLGMREGFDVALEMSGNPTAFREMICNMSHGGRIAMLGIPTEEMSINWRDVIFNMLHIKGIYGREMYETWYKMTVLLQSGLDIMPVITHRFSYKDYEQAFQVMRSANSGKVILNWEELQ
jgi:threonine 3-dehydrogenase